MDRKPNNKLPPPRTKPAVAPRAAREAGPMETANPQSPPSLEELANDPSRTHRTWYPKYGRVQKCDYCNGRSEGTLHVCSDCSVRICEYCARDRSWAVQRSRHFIDVDACNWAVKKPPKPIKPATQRGAKRPAQAPPDNAPSGPAARRRKLDKFHSRTNDGNDGEDDSADDDNRPSNLRARPAPRAAPIIDLDGGDRGQSRMRPLAIQPRHASGEVATPHTTPQTSPVPRPRPNPRLAATRALLGMSEHARRSSPGNFGDDDANEHDDPEYHDQDNGDDVVYQNRGYVGADPRRYPSNQPGVNGAPQARTDRARGPSPEARGSGAPVSEERPSFTAENEEERDNLIKDVYQWIYGTVLTLKPQRMRTLIPDMWEGDRFAPALQPDATYSTRQGSGQNQGDSRSGILPPLRSYEQYSYRDSIENPYNPPSTSYHPTSRTTPAYHPHNNHTPAEVEEIQQDRQTLAEMQDAWVHHPQLARMAGNEIGVGIGIGNAGETRGSYAIGVLWDVLDARRSRVLIREDSQTVRWFVSERDRQFRVEHLARESRSVGGGGGGYGLGYGSGRRGEADDGHGGKNKVQE